MDENHGRKRAHDSKYIIMLIMLVNACWYNSVFDILPHVPRDLPQVSPPTDTNFKLYDSCMPYLTKN